MARNRRIGILIAGTLAAGLAAGPATAAGQKTEICHYPNHEFVYFSSSTPPGGQDVGDYYYAEPGTRLTSFFRTYCGYDGGVVILVSNSSLDAHGASAYTSLPTD